MPGDVVSDRDLRVALKGMGRAGSKLSLGWIFVSYLMIAGGFTIALLLLAVLGVDGEWVGYGVFFLGAFAGGFFAGRASEHKTVVEPAIAGALFIGSLIAAFSMLPGARLFWDFASTNIVVGALKIAFVTALGGVVGGVAGERSAPDVRPVTGLRWAGIASLIAWGSMFVLMVVLGIALGWDDDGWVVPVLAIGGGAFLSGLVTQRIAPMKKRAACGFGMPLAMITMCIMVVVDGDTDDGSVFGGLAILGLLTWGVGAIGAAIGAAGRSDDASAPGPSGNLPSARLQ